MSICRKLLETLKAATVERQVEDAYNEMLKAEFPGIELTYPYGCDGYFEFEAGGGRHRAIVEYKFDEDMSSKTARSKVLAQVLFYMKRFELDGRPLPTVVLVADRNECFALHANDLVKWLDFDAKWDGAPSNAGRDNPELVLALASDEAKAVLAEARRLVRASMKYRALFDDEHPEYQVVRCFDAGWYQVKAVLKEYMPEELKNFRELTKKLADRMRPAVYGLGFLRK